MVLEPAGHKKIILHFKNIIKVFLLVLECLNVGNSVKNGKRNGRGAIFLL